MLLNETDAITQCKAALVATVDPSKGARMPPQGAHLLKDRKKHQLAQRDLPASWQLHESATARQRNSHDFDIADIGLQGRLDVMGADDEQVVAVVGAEQHATVKARRRCQIAPWQRTASLLLDRCFPRLTGGAAESSKGL